MKTKYLLILIILFIPLVSSSYYVKDPALCPSLDALNYPAQSCVPNDICGVISGIVQCYNTSTISIPSISSSNAKSH